MTHREPRRKRHHFIPRFLLQNFTDGARRIYVHARDDEWTPRQTTVDRAGLERYLYAPGPGIESDRDPTDDTVEKWLDKEIDTPAAPVIERLTSGAPIADLSPDECHALANFVAVLDMRTPAVRDLLVPEFHAAAVGAISDTALTRRELRKQGIHATKREIRQREAGYGKPAAAGMAKPAWLSYIQESRGLARMNVKARRWLMIDAPNGTEFITSDLGIAKSRLGPLSPDPWAMGTALGLAHWVVPLSSRRALTVTPAGYPELLSPSRELVVATNRRLCRDARRFVFSPHPLDIQAVFES